jgi:hypothetical protein
MQPGTEVEVRIDRNQQEETAVATLARRESVTRRTDIVPRRTGILPRR